MNHCGRAFAARVIPHPSKKTRCPRSAPWGIRKVALGRYHDVRVDCAAAGLPNGPAPATPPHVSELSGILTNSATRSGASRIVVDELEKRVEPHPPVALEPFVFILEHQLSVPSMKLLKEP